MIVAAHDGVRFGPDLVFTYGPLGFLGFPSVLYEDTLVLSTLAIAAVYLAALWLIARAAWRTWPIAVAALALFVAAQVVVHRVPFPERYQGTVVALCALFALVRGERRHGTAVPLAGLAVVAAPLLLVKLSAGVVAFVALALAAAVPWVDGRTPRGAAARSLAIAAGAYVAAVVALWLVAGQHLGDLPTWLRHAAEIAGGYPAAQAAEEPGRGGEYALAALSAALVLAVGIRGARDHPRGVRAVVVLMLAALLYLGFRQGFTAHVGGNALLYFAPPFIVVAAAFVRPDAWRLATVTLVTLLGACWVVADLDVKRVVTPFPESLAANVRAVVSPGERRRIRDRGREALRLAYPVPPAVLRALRGRTVHVDPWDIALVYAYPELRWRPPPVFQSYSAYTTELDRLNADFLVRRGPEYVLRREAAIGGRLPRFESPGYVLALICRYREVARFGAWQVLRRGPDRCGAPEPVATARAPFGTSTPVPRVGPRDILAARIELLDEPLVQRARGLLFKSSPIYVELGTGQAYTLLAGHAGALHVLRVPACLEYGRRVFDRRAFERVAVGRDAAELATATRPEAGRFRVRFERIPFACVRGQRPGVNRTGSASSP